jgi:D-xylose transport system substrate-binding protein
MKAFKIFLSCCFFYLANSPCFSQKIGFLMDDYISDRWFSDEKYFKETIKELRGEVLMEVANADTAAQYLLAKKLLDAGVNVLVVIPTDAHQASKIVDLATIYKVPVVSYDRLILSDKIAVYVSYDNVKVGRLQGQYALKKKPSGGYILLNGPTSDNNAVLFKAGQDEVLKPHIQSGKIKVLADVVMADWGELGAMIKINELVTDNKFMPDAIVAANDALATGAIASLPGSLLGKTVVTGQDADISGIRNIISGRQAMTVYKPIKPLARKAAELAMKLARGEKLERLSQMKSGNITVNAILLDPVAVDLSNYKETVIKDGHVKLPESEKK